jgi:hypothetical protein
MRKVFGLLRRPKSISVDNIRMDLGEIEFGGDWSHVIQDTDHWRAIVKTVINLGFHEMLGISRATAQLVVSREGLSSMEFVYEAVRHEAANTSVLSSGTLRRVALVRTDVSEELSASIIRVTRIGELGTLAVTV